MTIDECIDELDEIRRKYPEEGGDIELVLGASFGKDGRVESLSLQAEPRGGENEVIFEEPFEGNGTTFPEVFKWPKDKGPSLWKSDVTVYCGTEDEHKKELKGLIERFFRGQDIQVDFEYSGAGMYRFQAWMNRPEGLPLVALKWEGV